MTIEVFGTSAYSRLIVLVVLDKTRHSITSFNDAIARVGQELSDDPSLDELIKLQVEQVDFAAFKDTHDEVAWINEKLRGLVTMSEVGLEDQLAIHVVSENGWELDDEHRANLPPLQLLELPRGPSSPADGILALLRDLETGIHDSNAAVVTKRSLGWQAEIADPIIDMPTTLRVIDAEARPSDRSGTTSTDWIPDDHIDSVRSSTTKASPEVKLVARVIPTERVKAPSLADAPLSTTGRLMYFATLGSAPSWTAGLQVRRWILAVLEGLAREYPNTSVRLLALGDGISGQSQRATPSAFLRTAVMRSLGVSIPRPAGLLDMAMIFRDIEALVQRDLEAMKHVEPNRPVSVLCIVATNKALTADVATLRGLQAIRDILDFYWVTPPRAVDFVPGELVGERDLVLPDHPEIAEELLRKLERHYRDITRHQIPAPSPKPDQPMPPEL